jgi:hypothetical protein
MCMRATKEANLTPPVKVQSNTVSLTGGVSPTAGAATESRQRDEMCMRATKEANLTPPVKVQSNTDSLTGLRMRE